MFTGGDPKRATGQNEDEAVIKKADNGKCYIIPRKNEYHDTPRRVGRVDAQRFTY